MDTQPTQHALRYGSVCSGIEAVSLAWNPLGLEAAWFSEIEPFACAVLSHRYPGVQNLGDMTRIADEIRAGRAEAPDVLVGGPPCQAFSIAGTRRGSMTRAAHSPSVMWSLPMPSTKPGSNPTGRPQRSSLKTSRASLATAPTPLAACWAHLPANAMHSSRQGKNGRTQVTCMVPSVASRGGCSTLNISVSPNAANACFLSQVVVTTSIPPKYF